MGTYYILDKVGSDGIIKRDTPIYLLYLQKITQSKICAVINNVQNQPVDAKIAQRILGALKHKLGT